MAPSDGSTARTTALHSRPSISAFAGSTAADSADAQLERQPRDRPVAIDRTHPLQERSQLAGQRGLEIVLLLPLPDRLEETLALGQDHEGDLLVTEFRLLPCHGHGGLEAAEPVHEAFLERVLPGPDTPLGDFVDLGPGLAPAVCDLPHEVVVEGHVLIVDLLALVSVPGPVLREQVRVTAAADRLLRDAQLVIEPAQAELAAEDPDRTGDGRWLGHDRVAADRDVVPPRGRVVPHRDHDRLLLVCELDLAADDVGRGAEAAGAVHAQDDGLVARVLSGVPERL